MPGRRRAARNRARREQRQLRREHQARPRIQNPEPEPEPEPARRALTDEQIAKVRELRTYGWSLRAIADEFDMAYNTLRSALADVEAPMTDDEIKKARELRAAGYTHSSVAAAINRPLSTVLHYTRDVSPLTDEQIAEARRMRGYGCTFDEIADKLGIGSRVTLAAASRDPDQPSPPQRRYHRVNGSRLRIKPQPNPRKRRFALVTWSPTSYTMRKPKYFHTRESAQQAAPKDQPHSIVDVGLQPWHTIPFTGEIATRTRPPDTAPNPYESKKHRYGIWFA